MKTRLFALLLCVVMICATAVPAGAIDLSQYMFQLGGVDIPGYDYDKPYMYPSAFSNLLTVDMDKDGVLEPDEALDDVVHTVLNVVNLAKVEKGGEGPYASVPAYCFDFTVDIIDGKQYSLAMLNDFSGNDVVNNRLRAILRHSFPYIMDVSVLQSNINAWVSKSGGGDPVVGLTGAEAIMATQTAIWTLTNLLRVDDHLEGRTYTFHRKNSMYFDGYGDAVATEHTRNNSAQMIRYLLSLAPEEAKPTKECTIAEAVSSLKAEADGTYTATVRAKLSIKPNENVIAELQAFCGDLESAKVNVVDGQQEYLLTLKSIPSAEAKIDVAINGVQVLEDAFLLEPVSGRVNSQVMGGYITLEHTLDTRVRAVPATEPTVTPVPDVPAPPATGDSTPVALMAAMALLTLAGAMMLRRKHA